MITHKLIENLSKNNPHFTHIYEGYLSQCVQFDCGDYEEIPKPSGTEFAFARPPFPRTVLQFDHTIEGIKFTSLAIYMQNDECENYSLLICQNSGDEWNILFPVIISKNIDDSFNYKKLGYSEENMEVVKWYHAAALQIFYVMGCSNITTQNHAAPVALNKKRLRKGKPPLYEYKTLVLTLDAKSKPGESKGGTHASPRVHLRRGHIRKLDDFRRVWVQACVVVGSGNGMVAKDYKIKSKRSSVEERRT